MTILQSILLGIVQGITEFLPISSSGHLVLTPYFLGWDIPQQDAFIFDVLVQVATLFAVIIYFWRDLIEILRSFLKALIDRDPFRDQEARMGWYIVLATLPASVVGLVLKDTLETAFSSPLAVAFSLLGTAFLMAAAERLGKRTRMFEQMSWLDSIWIGSFQILALFPGFSRSGSTISAGILRSLDRTSAARFSFIMSVPIMLAAGVVAGIDLLQLPDLADKLLVYTPGFIASAITGYFAIGWLLKYLSQRPLYLFSIYCTCLSITTLLVYFVNR